jgi:hypothetical protein
MAVAYFNTSVLNTQDGGVKMHELMQYARRERGRERERERERDVMSICTQGPPIAWISSCGLRVRRKILCGIRGRRVWFPMLMIMAFSFDTK